MLKIGFDAKRAFFNHTGLGNYSRSVITSLAENFPEAQYYLYTTKQKINSRTSALNNKPELIVRTPKFPILKSLWRSRFVIPQLISDQIDLYHGLSHEIPVGIQNTGIKSVVTIHDLIFLRYPDYYKAADRKIYELKFKNACNNADQIIAISHQTKRDIIHFFGIKEEKITVIYQSCDAIFRKEYDAEKLETIKRHYQLPDQYILNIGTIEERKNLMLIAQSLKAIPENIKLVVVGKETPYAEKVKRYLLENGLTKRVLFLQNVAFEDLPGIYQQAQAFVYPSEFEGFGIPILEALNSGTPVIAATGSCLEEAGGMYSLYVAPKDHVGLAGAINLILKDEKLRTDMVQEGRKYAAHFTEKAHAENLMRLYKSVISKK